MEDTQNVPSSELLQMFYSLDSEIRGSFILTNDDHVSLNDMKAHMETFSILAKENTFRLDNGEVILHNEYHISMRIIIAIYRCVSREERSAIPSLLTIVRSVNRYWNACLHLQVSSGEVNGNLNGEKNKSSCNSKKDLVKKTLKILEEEQQTLLPITYARPFLALLNIPLIQRIVPVIYRLAGIVLSSSWRDTWYCLLSDKSASRTISGFLYNMKPKHIEFYTWVHDWSVGVRNARIFRKLTVGPLIDKATVERVDKEITSEFEVRIQYEEDQNFGVQVVPSKEKTRPISYYIVKSPGTKYKGKIVYYVHGGGFVGGKDANLYNELLIPIAHQLPGVTIVNVIVTPATVARFPKQGQELLDIYIHITRQRGLGFDIEDIIINGDSSGSNQSMTLLLMLNDLRRAGYLSGVKLPKELVFVVPLLEIPSITDPGMVCVSHILLQSMEVGVLCFPMMKRMLSLYFPWRKRMNNGRWALTDDINNETTPLEGGWIEDPLADENLDMMDSPYFHVSEYPHMEDFKDVRMSITSTTNCPLLPVSLHVCRKWPGKVDVKLLTGVPHNFPVLSTMTKQSEEGLRANQEFIKRAFDHSE